jgi:putative tricarboxylic transport membrane protein
MMTAWGSTSLSMGKFKHPGPGFLPFGLGVCLIILSLILIFHNWRSKTSALPFWPQQTWLRPLLGIVILGFYAFVIDRLGFILTTFIFLLIWMGLIERLKWKTILSISVGTTIVLYLLFAFFLEVPLPKGFLKLG